MKIQGVSKSLNGNVPGKILLVFGITVGTILLFIRAVNFPRILHNDAISYIAATGHQILYETSIPTGKWVPAAEWQAFWEPDQFGIFGEIVRGLNSTDIHPPFYFWILHIWSVIYGVKLSTGPLLNIPFHILICLMIYKLSRKHGFSSWISATAAILWMLSYSTLDASTETRQYSLLGLAVICFIYFLYLYKPSSPPRIFYFVSVFMLAGLLIHYQFFLVVGIAMAFKAFQFLRGRQWNSIRALILSGISAFTVFWFLNPGFIQSFIHQRSIAQPFRWERVMVRLNTSIISLSELFVPEQIAQSRYLILLWLTVFVITALIIYKHYMKNKIAVSTQQLNDDNFAAIVSIMIISLIVVLYVFAFSPRHAMGSRYLMIVSPLLFFVLAKILTSANRAYPIQTSIFTLAILLIQVFSGIYQTYDYLRDARLYIHPDFLSTPAPLVLDSIERGILPRNLWFANPESPVYAAAQGQLIEHFPDMEDYDTIYYLSNDNNEYDNTIEKQAVILELLEKQGYRIRKLTEDYSLPATIFELNREN